MKKILVCGIIVLLTTTGCGKVAKLENGQDAVVNLSNGAISVDDLYQDVKNRYALSSLIDMMDEKILEEKYGKELMEEEKTEINSQIDTWLETFGTEQKLLQQVQSYFGVNTMSELREYLSLQFRRNKAIEEYTKTTVTDKDIQKYYEEEIFGDIKVSHILIAPETTSSMTTAEKTAAEEEALKKAEEVISKLKNGEKFEDVAKQYSTDELTKNDGGDLGFITHGDKEETFEQAAKNLEIGAYTTTPVKTSFGYHIILKVEQKEKIDLDSIRNDIIEDLATEKLENDATYQINGLAELRKEYKMEIQDDELKKQYDTYIENSLAQAKEQNKENNK